MGAKQVDSRDNGHTARTYGNPLGVECEACGRRALVPLDRLGTPRRRHAAAARAAVQVFGCGSRDVSLWLFAKRDEADAWSEETGPGF